MCARTAHLPGLPVLPHQTDEGINLCRRDVLFQKLPVVVEQSSDRVFSQHIIPNLLLHEAELLGYVFLQGQENEGEKQPYFQSLFVNNSVVNKGLRKAWRSPKRH